MARKTTEKSARRALSLWERPEDAGDALVCFATTFTFDATFFETECLGRFLAMDNHPSEGESVAYLVEREEKLAQARVAVLVDRQHARDKESLRWDVIGVSIPGRIQHAKLSVLLWANHLRLIVGSGNLTMPGYRKNLEVFGSLDLTPTEGDRNTHLEALAFLEEMVEGQAVGMRGSGTARDRALAAAQQVRARVEQWGESKRSGPRLVLGSTSRSVVTGIRDILPPRASMRQLYAVAPFFDHDSRAPQTARALASMLAKRDSHVYIDARTEKDAGDHVRVFASKELVNGLRRAGVGVTVRAVSSEQIGEEPQESEVRDLHAKMLYLMGETHILVVAGSSNVTAAGLGALENGGNAEANLAWLVRVGSPEAAALEGVWPRFGDDISLDSPDVSWDPIDEGQGEESLPALPVAFCDARWDPATSTLLVTLVEGLPDDWHIATEEDGVPVLTSQTHGPGEHSLLLDAERPPLVLLVTWISPSGPVAASWPVNVTTPSALTAPEALRGLTLAELVEVLASTRPLADAVGRVVAKRAGKNAMCREELDPLRRHDSAEFLLRRMRRLAVALERLRERLERPVASMDAFEWRVSGPVGVLPLAEALVREARTAGEAKFGLAELALAVSRVSIAKVSAAGTDVAHLRARLDSVVVAIESQVGRLLGWRSAGTICEQGVRRGDLLMYAPFEHDTVSLRNDRISEDDADRQTAAAVEILRRLGDQPGVVLADEVGMGKTFVALAAAFSVLRHSAHAGPVVVMCPPALEVKWLRDWGAFLSLCVSADARVFSAKSARSGVDFLKLLDDEPDRCARLIVLTHGAMSRGVGDGFTKLAIVRRALRHRKMGVHKEAFTRWAGAVLGMKWVESGDRKTLSRLLDLPPSRWRGVLRGDHPSRQQDFDDNPVPASVVDALDEMPGSAFDSLVDAIRDVPLRESKHLDERLQRVRRALNDEVGDVWKLALVRARFESPLLVLDEAHHVKNPKTRLASLFASEEAVADVGTTAAGGPLGGRFARMLFLTATPFQLGHGELIRVLQRFDGVRWQGTSAPTMGREQFGKELESLAHVMDDAQAAALRLDRAWSRLDAESLGVATLGDHELDGWWSQFAGPDAGEPAAGVAAHVAATREAMAHAEKALQPWVLRHVKATHLPGAANTARRRNLPGAAILDSAVGHRGLEIGADVLLPFLLAGRAEGLLAAASSGRALFAEGLSSSFEAYQETRRHSDTRDAEEPEAEQPVSTAELEWYLARLDEALPRESSAIRSAHPKILATTKRAVELWRQGEKVLIFCHYRATGRALRLHISEALKQAINEIAMQRLGVASSEEAERKLVEIGEYLFSDRPQAQLESWIGHAVEPFGRPDAVRDGDAPLSQEAAAAVNEVFRRFIRTPGFLARYFPLENDSALQDVGASLDASAGGLQLRSAIEEFCAFLVKRCTPEERDRYLAALRKVQTGSLSVRDTVPDFDDGDNVHDGARAAVLPNVRLANGMVTPETRQRLLLTFNTPLYPEILIASSVLAEGVDLHLHCRHVIHHDLCWNPSTLEQRTGRVDRIGCLAERVGASIHLFLPYIAATQDEKMFRVVRDRERWFNIVMGENYEIEEAATERRAARVPLPPALQKALSMSLHP